MAFDFLKKTTEDAPQPEKIQKDAPPSLNMLIMIVNRDKSEIYENMLYDYEVNSFVSIMANGSASTEVARKLGVGTAKSAIFALVREDKSSQLLDYLESRFKTIKGGKGIAFTVPLAAIISVSAYQFLSNQAPEV